MKMYIQAGEEGVVVEVKDIAHKIDIRFSRCSIRQDFEEAFMHVCIE